MALMSDSDGSGQPPAEPHALRQLAAFICGPVAVLASMQLKYVFVPWACSHGTTALLQAITFGGVLVAAASLALAYREWRLVGGGWPDDEGGWRGRTRFLAMLALLLSGASMIVILAQWVPELLLSPCQR
jgi:hypothetical protein